MPTYEAVDVLRRAKAKKGIGENEYNTLRKEVFEHGKDSREVRKELTAMIRQREELNPQEARDKKRVSTLRRFLGILKALKQEIELSKLAPASIIKEASSLIKKLEEEIAHGK
ncbi:MAG: hypothetical protein NTV07_01575 [Candidatus Omnitrophica bacterium]|nr:hypothetical protein [Candidatus Omnitrophota bacterium]